MVAVREGDGSVDHTVVEHQVAEQIGLFRDHLYEGEGALPLEEMASPSHQLMVRPHPVYRQGA